eukprot:1148212-Pelagomonas_calceolata.AAC.4
MVSVGVHTPHSWIWTSEDNMIDAVYIITQQASSIGGGPIESDGMLLCVDCPCAGASRGGAGCVCVELGAWQWRAGEGESGRPRASPTTLQIPLALFLAFSQAGCVKFRFEGPLLRRVDHDAPSTIGASPFTGRLLRIVAAVWQPLLVVFRMYSLCWMDSGKLRESDEHYANDDSPGEGIGWLVDLSRIFQGLPASRT